jgi:predicted O-methyltransferase YrrM
MASETEKSGRLSGWVTQLRWAMKCPGYYLLRLVARPGSPAEVRFHRKRQRTGLAKTLGVPLSTVDAWFNEIAQSDRLQQVEKRMKELPYSGTFRGGPELYVLVRGAHPGKLVETGVGLGYSSAYILEALAQNHVGALVSVDLPNSDRSWKLPTGEAPGSLVPPEVRDRWDLKLGDTRRLLPQVLNEAGTLDFFFHDSEHTYETMMFEYREAFARLPAGGLLVSDDTMWNAAMLDFARAERAPIEFVYHRGGGAPFALLRKPRPSGHRPAARPPAP